MTEDELNKIEAHIAEPYDNTWAQWDALHDDMRALIAEVRLFHDMVWPLYIAGRENHKDGDGEPIDPVEYVNNVREAKKRLTRAKVTT